MGLPPAGFMGWRVGGKLHPPNPVPSSLPCPGGAISRHAARPGVTRLHGVPLGAVPRARVHPGSGGTLAMWLRLGPFLSPPRANPLWERPGLTLACPRGTGEAVPGPLAPTHGSWACPRALLALSWLKGRSPKPWAPGGRRNCSRAEWLRVWRPRGCLWSEHPLKTSVHPPAGRWGWSRALCPRPGYSLVGQEEGFICSRCCNDGAGLAGGQGSGLGGTGARATAGCSWPRWPPPFWGHCGLVLH